MTSAASGHFQKSRCFRVFRFGEVGLQATILTLLAGYSTSTRWPTLLPATGGAARYAPFSDAHAHSRTPTILWHSARRERAENIPPPTPKLSPTYTHTKHFGYTHQAVWLTARRKNVEAGATVTGDATFPVPPADTAPFEREEATLCPLPRSCREIRGLVAIKVVEAACVRDREKT